MLVPGQKPIDYSEHIMNMAFMPRRKGELTRAEMDRTYPHPIALFAELFLDKLEQAAVCHGNHLPARTIRSNARIGITMSFASLQSARGAFHAGIWRRAVRSARQGRVQTG
ncbi:hypothetical protein AS026_03235 [Rhizobium altiplani]|uniref:Uncharacterized protein n=1 Tax=Rhizobium altiplani TaxID=1864509 RepID=A0A120FMD8_9HYPH|nr:hypothetical protein AS026_03235 [Rhizobium altiplani]